MEFDDNDPEKVAIWNAMRGETIIALKRLDDTQDDGRGEIDVLKDIMEEDILNIEVDAGGKNRQLANLDGFDDSGKLKGELVRFLYEANLLKRDSSTQDRDGLLRGADLVRVVLNDAPMPNANLRRTWISGGQFQESNLNGSNLQGAELNNANFEAAILENVDLNWANLQNANLRGTDLSSASLKNADLRGADLTDIVVTSGTMFTNACYDASTVGLEDLSLESHGLIDANNEPLEKKCSEIKGNA